MPLLAPLKSCFDLEHTSKRSITEETKNEISLVFSESDQGNKGYLTREDVKVAVVNLLGYKPSKYEVDDMMKSLPAGSFGMPLEKFMEVMCNKISIVDEDEHIRQVFLTMDTQCQGFLTLENLMHAVNQVAPHLSAHAVQSAFKEIDRDGDGRVSYKDFEFMMKYSTEDP